MTTIAFMIKKPTFSGFLFFRCEALVEEYLHWNDPVGLVIVSLTFLGLVLTALTLVLYIINISNPLIKASSRELTGMMFWGIVTSFGCVLAFVMEPSGRVCMTRFLGVALCFTLLYAPLLTKTIRIYRIFEAGKHMIRKPSCVSSRSQMAIVLSIILIHVRVKNFDKF